MSTIIQYERIKHPLKLCRRKVSEVNFEELVAKIQQVCI